MLQIKKSDKGQEYEKAKMFTGMKQLTDTVLLIAANSLNSRGQVLALSRLESHLTQRDNYCVEREKNFQKIKIDKENDYYVYGYCNF